MKETKKIIDGKRLRIFQSKDYFALKDLQREYEKIKTKTFFDLLDSCNGIWALTIE